MAVTLLQRLASGAAAPVLVLAVGRGRRIANRLRLEGGVRVVETPRHASVLVVGSPIPEPLRSAARLLHDNVPHPRAVVTACTDETYPAAERARDGELPGTIREVFEELCRGERDSTDSLIPDDNPVEWRGVGPHGQGGEGMMGGKPYGRRMAMVGGELRDGLELSRLSVTLGPFLPWMPPGLELAVDLQGDVIQRLEPRVPEGLPADRPDVFDRAQTEPVAVAALELARASHHLEATADMLFVHGLEALARRTLGVAQGLEAGGAESVRRLSRHLDRSMALRPAIRGVGPLEADEVEGLGPVARAAGDERDARLRDPAYEGLEFEPVVGRRGDAEARVRQWLNEATQALELADRAGDRIREPGPIIEGPRGPMGERLGQRERALLVRRAPGMAFDEFVTMLVSLDIDPARLPPSDDYGDSRVGSHAGDDDDHGGHHGHHHHDGGH